jgi:hypothetical protein
MHCNHQRGLSYFASSLSVLSLVCAAACGAPNGGDTSAEAVTDQPSTNATDDATRKRCSAKTAGDVCLQCCYDAYPAASKNLEDWSACLKACPDLGSDCTDECKATSDSSCAALGGACEAMSSCGNACGGAGDSSD